jgi:hypothetical protein
MKKVTLISDSDEKIDLLVKLAKEMGVTPVTNYELTDEEMALPGAQVSEQQLEEWLAKGDGDEEYTSEKMKDLISRR